MHQEQIDLVDFVSEFHDHFCEVEKIPAHGFALHIGDQPILILFDQRHLHQILWNLCRNGWRHSQQESASLTLFIYPSKDNMSVVLQILDDGPGIPAEARLHIFEPFYTTVSTGTGLGLYIARELCEANGANIQYIAREKGALFSIKFKRV
jgi:two-component system sensor histidine kinase PilS (NtrC family)